MNEQRKEIAEHFQFPITPFLQKRLNSLSKTANPDGQKIARWTDIILAALNKLQPDDLIRIRRERETFLSAKHEEQMNG